MIAVARPTCWTRAGGCGRKREVNGHHRGSRGSCRCIEIRGSGSLLRSSLENRSRGRRTTRFRMMRRFARTYRSSDRLVVSGPARTPVCKEPARDDFNVFSFK
uniref:(northern house mosquito) hypothetical protein n=1 Tax=Culex pipiens TaxID=7175 RepID=A0A8D8HWG6_CULPI